MTARDRREAAEAPPRDQLADSALLAHSREMTMSERLEHALAWNKLASELREGVAASRSTEQPSQ